MVDFAAQRVMELEVEGLSGTAHGDRDKGSYFPSFLEPTRRRSRATPRSYTTPWDTIIAPRLTGTTIANIQRYVAL